VLNTEKDFSDSSQVLFLNESLLISRILFTGDLQQQNQSLFPLKSVANSHWLQQRIDPADILEPGTEKLREVLFSFKKSARTLPIQFPQLSARFINSPSLHTGMRRKCVNGLNTYKH